LVFVGDDGIEAPQIHTPSGFIVAQIEFFAGTFPSVVAPKIEARIATNGAFEFAKIEVGDCIIGVLLRLIGY